MTNPARQIVQTSSDPECADLATEGSLVLCNGVCPSLYLNDALCGQCNRACLEGYFCLGFECVSD